MAKSGFVPDNTNIKKSSGTPNLFFDSKDSIFFERDPDNIAYKVTSTQIPVMVDGEGSDTLRLTPPEAFQSSYGIDSKIIAEALSPIKESVVIGPPANNRPKTRGYVTPNTSCIL